MGAEPAADRLHRNFRSRYLALINQNAADTREWMAGFCRISHAQGFTVGQFQACRPLHMGEKCINAVSHEGNLQPMARKRTLLNGAAVGIFLKAAFCLAGKSKRRIEAGRAIFIAHFHKIGVLAQKRHFEPRIRNARCFYFRLIKSGHEALALFRLHAAGHEMRLEKAPRFAPVRTVKRAGSSKDRLQGLERQAKTAAPIAVIFGIVGGTAKSGKCQSLIVPIPAGAIAKARRAENPRQVVHCRFHFNY